MDMPHSCALLLQQHAHFCSFEACDVLQEWTTNSLHSFLRFSLLIKVGS